MKCFGKPEILLITDVSPALKGGSVSYIFPLLRGVSARVLALCAITKVFSDDNYDIKGIFYSNHYIKSKFIRKIYSLFLYVQLSIFPLFWVFWYLKSIKLVICTEVLPGGISGYLCKIIFNRKYITIIYGEEFTMGIRKSLQKRVIKLVLMHSEAIITISNFAKNKLISFGIDGNKIHIIYPAVEMQGKIVCTKRIADIFKNYDLYNKKIVLMVGRLIRRKGFDNAIRVLPRIKNKFHDVKLVIAGKGIDREYLRKLADDNNVTHDVIFLEDLLDEEVNFLYTQCYVYLLPTRNLDNGDTEGFGIVFLEANLHGKAVIGGMAGGTVDAVIDGLNGLLVNGDDLTDLENKLTIILKDPDYTKLLGRQGRERIERDFNMESQRRKFDNIVASLIQ